MGTFKHVGDRVVGHQNTGNAIHFNLIQKSAIWYFMKISNIRNSYIVYQHRHILYDAFVLQLLENIAKKSFRRRVLKISDHIICLHLLSLPLCYFSEGLYHFLLISGNHANIEAQSCELLTKAESYSIASSCDDCPWVLAIPGSIVFLGEDHFD